MPGSCSLTWATPSFARLLLEVWGLDYIDRPHYLRVHMAHLRQKLEAAPAQPQHFIIELQVGYRLMGVNGYSALPQSKASLKVTDKSTRSI
nr:winged helix-turn-helix domain-containing protein [Pseudomonas salomonii]